VVRFVAEAAEERRLCAGVIASSSANFTEIKTGRKCGLLRELDRPFEVTESGGPIIH